MKKIYLIAGLLFIGSTVSAQTVVNGNFEAAFIELIPGKAFETQGWGQNFYTKVTTNPGEGAQSVSLKTIVDPATATAQGFNNDTIAGQMGQIINGAVATPALLNLKFMYKYAPVMGDAAIVVVEVYDTLLAGDADDVVLYQGIAALTAAQSAWTPRTVTVTANPNGTGTANQVFIIAASSASSVFSNPALPKRKEGSELFLDKVEITNSTVGVDEVTTASASVYPNPATDVLNFKLEGVDATSITIFGLDGKILISQSVSGATGSVNVAELNSGMYIYQIATVNGETVKSTFVKK